MKRIAAPMVGGIFTSFILELVVYPAIYEVWKWRFGKTAIAGLMLAIQLGAAQFPMRHEHLRKFCDGTMTVDETGIRFVGPKGHVWNWPYADIQQLTLLPWE